MNRNASATTEVDSQLQGARYLACHDLFWPRIDLDVLRDRLRLPPGISDTQLELAARASVELAAQEFAQWRRCLRERGYRRLIDVARHDQGRALSTCYLRLVEAGTRRALARHVTEVGLGAPLRNEVSHE